MDKKVHALFRYPEFLACWLTDQEIGVAALQRFFYDLGTDSVPLYLLLKSKTE